MSTIELGLEVAKLRRRAGLSQAEMAEKAGTTQAVISRIEGGKANPGWELLERIGEAGGKSPRITFGPSDRALSRSERSSRAKKALGEFEFDPWDRDPGPVERKSLIADGLTRERFARS